MYEAEGVDIVKSGYAYLVLSLMTFVLQGTGSVCKHCVLGKLKFLLQVMSMSVSLLSNVYVVVVLLPSNASLVCYIMGKFFSS